MESAEEIRGTDRDRLIEGLKNNKTLVKMRVGRSEDTTLTLVIDTRVQGKEFLFSVDCPEWMRRPVLRHGAQGVHFEWTAQDRIPYRFSASEVRVIEGEIWFSFPEVILYCQRRRDYRLPSPEGTFLSFRREGVSCRLELSDISVGGLRFEQWVIKTLPAALLLREGDTLSEVEVCFPSGETIPIPRAEIRWVHVDDEKKRRQYGVRFRDVDRQHERQLTSIIYRYQREYLRRRLPLDEAPGPKTR